jgi:hypothetical protein
MVERNGRRAATERDTEMSFIGGIGGAVRAIASRAAAARRERETDRVLETLPRHLLRDIGFDRTLSGFITRTQRD